MHCVTAWKKWKTCVKLAMDDMHCHCLKEVKNLCKTGNRWHALCHRLNEMKNLCKTGNERQRYMCFCVYVCVCVLFCFFQHTHVHTQALLPSKLPYSTQFWQIITYTGLLSFYLLHCLKHKNEVLFVSPEFGQIFTCISPKTHLLHESEVISVSPESGQIFTWTCSSSLFYIAWSQEWNFLCIA